MPYPSATLSSPLPTIPIPTTPHTVATLASGGIGGNLVTDLIPSTQANDGAAFTNGTQTLIAAGQRERIQQDGTVTHLDLRVNGKTSLTSIQLRVYRPNYVNNHLEIVGSSEAIAAAAFTADDVMHTYLLATPIAGVKAGDFWALTIIGTGTTGYIRIKAAGGMPSIWDFGLWAIGSDGTGAIGFPVPWTESVVGYSLQGGVRMSTCPIISFGGDSILAGIVYATGYHGSYPGPWTDRHARYCVGAYLADQHNAAIFGGSKFDSISGSTSGQWAALTTGYLDLYVIPCRPRVFFEELGFNDIHGGVTMAAWLANKVQIWQKCRAAGIIPVTLTLPPWVGADDPVGTDPTGAEGAKVPSWNSGLRSAAQRYAVHLIDIAQITTPYGNTNDVEPTNPPFIPDGLGTHLCPLGSQAWASLIAQHCLAQAG